MNDRIGCGELESLLDDCLVERTPPEVRLLISRHLRACAACTQTLLERTRVRQLLMQLPRAAMPPLMKQRLLAAHRAARPDQYSSPAVTARAPHSDPFPAMTLEQRPITPTPTGRSIP